MKDLIIKILKEHSSYLDRSRTYEGIYDESFDYVADAIIKQFAISGVMQWVAVEEKLPPKYENVIVRNEKDIVSTDEISDNGWVFEEISKVKVTHWMHLPKTPFA